MQIKQVPAYFASLPEWLTPDVLQAIATASQSAINFGTYYAIKAGCYRYNDAVVLREGLTKTERNPMDSKAKCFLNALDKGVGFLFSQSKPVSLAAQNMR